MSRTIKIIRIASIITLLSIAFAFPALGKSIKRKGSMYSSDEIDITNIESKSLERNKSGLIWYSLKANVRNHQSRKILVTFCLQAVDKIGNQIKNECFYNQVIDGYMLRRIYDDKRVINPIEYKKILKWKVDSVTVK